MNSNDLKVCRNVQSPPVAEQLKCMQYLGQYEEGGNSEEAGKWISEREKQDQC